MALIEAHHILHVSRMRVNVKNENRAIDKVRKGPGNLLPAINEHVSVHVYMRKF
jgi:hypothetical protein